MCMAYTHLKFNLPNQMQWVIQYMEILSINENFHEQLIILK